MLNKTDKKARMRLLVSRPFFPLEEVRQLVEEDFEDVTKEKVIFTAKSRSIDKIIEVHRSLKGRRMTSVKAAEFIKYRLLELCEDHFSETKTGQWGDPLFVVDIYGLEYEGIPYYIKFRIDRETAQLDEISFHPLEHDLMLANGTILKARSQ